MSILFCYMLIYALAGVCRFCMQSIGRLHFYLRRAEEIRKGLDFGKNKTYNIIKS